VPAPPRPEPTRDAAGRVQAGPGTTELARRGGVAAAEARKFRRLLGLADFAADHPYQPYHALAREHRQDHAEHIAATVGGGQLSPGVSGIIASASLALAASRYLYDLGADQGDPKLLGQAARLADQSRTALLTAHELAAREAAARARTSPADLHRQLAAAFGPPADDQPRQPRQDAPGRAPVVETTASPTDDAVAPSGDEEPSNG
jgi:predicted N-formylglutamate amidohydrolase